MKRPELKELGVGNKNCQFIAIYKSSGKRYKVSGITFADICVKLLVNNENGDLLTDHVWISKVSLKQVVKLKKGDVVMICNSVIYDYHRDETGLRGGVISKIK